MPAGRPSKLTPEVHKKIVGCLQRGSSVVEAYTSAGINEAAYFRWMRYGKARASGKYRRFRKDAIAARSIGAAILQDAWFSAVTGGKGPDGVWREPDWRGCKEALVYRRRMSDMDEKAKPKSLTPDEAMAQQVEHLETIVRLSQRDGDTKTYLSAVQDLGRLRGLYPTDKAAMSRASLDDRSPSHVLNREQIQAQIDVWEAEGGTITDDMKAKMLAKADDG